MSFKALPSNERTQIVRDFCIRLLLHERSIEGKSADRSGTAPWGAYLDGDVIVLSRPSFSLSPSHFYYFVKANRL